MTIKSGASTAMTPRRRKPRVLTLLLGCCLALLLSACSSLTFQSTFDKEGTARHQATFVFDRANLLPQDISRIERGLNGAITRATNDGFDVQRISTSSEIGLRVTGSSMDALDTGAALNILFNTLLPTSDDAPVAPFSGTFSRESGAVGGSRFELSLNADGDVLAEAIRGISPLSPQLQSAESMAGVISIRVIAILPGTVRSTNGQAAGNRVTWLLPLRGSSELSAVSTIGQSTPWPAVIGVVVLAAMLTGSAGYLGWSLLRRRPVAMLAAHDAAEEMDTAMLPHDSVAPRTAPDPVAVTPVTNVHTFAGLIERLRLLVVHFATDPRPPRPLRQTRGARREVDTLRREQVQATTEEGTPIAAELAQPVKESSRGVDAEGN